MLYGCYAMFGLSLVAALVIITMIWSRLALYGTSGTTRVPTLWIVLGPLGQGITAAGLLGANAALAVSPEMAGGMSVFAVLFGVPVWGFAVLWIALATQLTVRTLRRGMPFALTWWSLTFPVGTFVTGTTQLANHTELPAFRVAAVIAYVGLLCTWGLVTVQTARGSVRRKPVRAAADGGADQSGEGPAEVVAPCCRRVGGSDDNTELSRVSGTPRRAVTPFSKFLVRPRESPQRPAHRRRRPR